MGRRGVHIVRYPNVFFGESFGLISYSVSLIVSGNFFPSTAVVAGTYSLGSLLLQVPAYARPESTTAIILFIYLTLTHQYAGPRVQSQASVLSSTYGMTAGFDWRISIPTALRPVARD